jgi:hypothetical protein
MEMGFTETLEVLERHYEACTRHWIRAGFNRMEAENRALAEILETVYNPESPRGERLPWDAKVHFVTTTMKGLR